jgi:K+-sensing histidine kinase KdpD
MRPAPIAVSLAIILVVTTTLFYVKESQQGAQHLVFFYLLPNAFVAIVYGSVLSMFCAIVATLVAAFFLYDPLYSLCVSDPREVGELIVFAGIGLLGAKCIALTKRPPTRWPKFTEGKRTNPRQQKDAPAKGIVAIGRRIVHSHEVKNVASSTGNGEWVIK